MWYTSILQMGKGPLLKLTLGHVAQVGALRYKIVIADGVNYVCDICPGVSVQWCMHVYYLHCQHRLQYQRESFRRSSCLSIQIQSCQALSMTFCPGCGACARSNIAFELKLLRLENAPAV